MEIHNARERIVATVDRAVFLRHLRGRAEHAEQKMSAPK
jgi:hypothetical protein